MKRVLEFKYVLEKDKMEHRGTIGVLTHKCKSYFNGIQMGPSDEFEVPSYPEENKGEKLQEEEEEDAEEEEEMCDALDPIDSLENLMGTQPKISLAGPKIKSHKIIKKAVKRVSKKIKFKLPEDKKKTTKNQDPM